MSKIIIDRDLLEQALEAFRQIAWSNDSEWQADCANESALKLRAALEQPQVELTSVEQYQLQMAAISIRWPLSAPQRWATGKKATASAQTTTRYRG